MAQIIDYIRAVAAICVVLILAAIFLLNGMPRTATSTSTAIPSSSSTAHATTTTVSRTSQNWEGMYSLLSNNTFNLQSIFNLSQPQQNLTAIEYSGNISNYGARAPFNLSYGLGVNFSVLELSTLNAYRGHGENITSAYVDGGYYQCVRADDIANGGPQGLVCYPESQSGFNSGSLMSGLGAGLADAEQLRGTTQSLIPAAFAMLLVHSPQTAITLRNTSIRNSSFNGLPCKLVSSNYSTNYDNDTGGTEMKGRITTCISKKYNVPLTAHFTIRNVSTNGVTRNGTRYNNYQLLQFSINVTERSLGTGRGKPYSLPSRTACFGVAELLTCYNPVIGTNGVLELNLSISNVYTIQNYYNGRYSYYEVNYTNVTIACSTLDQFAELGDSSDVRQYEFAKLAALIMHNQTVSGRVAIQCYNQTGAPITSLKPGDPQYFNLFLNYTEENATSPNAPLGNGLPGPHVFTATGIASAYVSNSSIDAPQFNLRLNR